MITKYACFTCDKDVGVLFGHADGNVYCSDHFQQPAQPTAEEALRQIVLAKANLTYWRKQLEDATE